MKEPKLELFSVKQNEDVNLWLSRFGRKAKAEKVAEKTDKFLCCILKRVCIKMDL